MDLGEEFGGKCGIPRSLRFEGVEGERDTARFGDEWWVNLGLVCKSEKGDEETEARIPLIFVFPVGWKIFCVSFSEFLAVFRGSQTGGNI